MHCKTWRLRAALAIAVATAWLPVAQAADTLTFDEPALANLYAGFEEIALGDYRAYFQSDGGLIGMADDLPASTAPLGNPTPFATALNSGVFSLFRADGAAFDLLGFDFVHVPHPDSPPPPYPMVLVILGGSEDAGGWLVDPTATNQSFTRYSDPAQMAAFRNVTSLNFTICSLDPETQEVCTFNLGSAGQFALDNITLQSPVPEPAVAWLWAAGLGALWLRRRQQTLSPSRAPLALPVA